MVESLVNLIFNSSSTERSSSRQMLTQTIMLMTSRCTLTLKPLKWTRRSAKILISLNSRTSSSVWGLLSALQERWTSTSTMNWLINQHVSIRSFLILKKNTQDLKSRRVTSTFRRRMPMPSRTIRMRKLTHLLPASRLTWMPVSV